MLCLSIINGFLFHEVITLKQKDELKTVKLDTCNEVKCIALHDEVISLKQEIKNIINISTK